MNLHNPNSQPNIQLLDFMSMQKQSSDCMSVVSIVKCSNRADKQECQCAQCQGSLPASKCTRSQANRRLMGQVLSHSEAEPADICSLTSLCTQPYAPLVSSALITRHTAHAKCTCHLKANVEGIHCMHCLHPQIACIACTHEPHALLAHADCMHCLHPLIACNACMHPLHMLLARVHCMYCLYALPPHLQQHLPAQFLEPLILIDADHGSGGHICSTALDRGVDGSPHGMAPSFACARPLLLCIWQLTLAAQQGAHIALLLCLLLLLDLPLLDLH